jgi:hypothetical protein
MDFMGEIDCRIKRDGKASVFRDLRLPFQGRRLFAD